MTIKIKKILFMVCLASATFAVAHFALALDVGLDQAAGTGLTAVDPRIIAANIIRIALGFLGILAIGLIIYAGWLWMMAAGNEENIERAKKILTNAVIGLIIILSAFAIASFVLSQLLGATGATSGDGTVCDPACSGANPYCCNNSCQAGPCGGTPIGGGESFRIISTRPRHLESDVIRNVEIKVFLSQAIASNITQTVLNDNFKVEKIAAIDPATSPIVETPLAPRLVAGQATASPDRTEISYKADGLCGNEAGTLNNCLPRWSKFKVTVNSLANGLSVAGGLISINGQTLSCDGASCEFVFSTGDLIDTAGPQASIVPSQICKDDGTLKPGANEVTGSARDDIGLFEIRFYQQAGDGGKVYKSYAQLSPTLYFTDKFKFDTSAMAVNDKYEFGIYASDLASHTVTSGFTATIRPGHCCNGVKDGNEIDMDCGGDCGACDGAACANDMNAPASGCNNNLCASQTCRSGGSTLLSCAAAGYAAGTNSCCLCQRPPVITGLSPVGGFCANDKNKPCLANDDCGAAGKCDLNTPNGAAGNFFTIYGKYFGASRGKVFASNGAGGWIEAKLADDLAAGNNKCGDQVWTDGQIIAVIPNGAKTGAVKVENTGGLSAVSGATGLPDLLINTIDRPGVCLLNPNHGKQDETINYNGIKFSGVSPYFGNLNNKIDSLDKNFNNRDGTAKVPNLIAGLTTSFVMKDKVASNFLNFTKDEEPYKGPAISSFDPREGSAGQYVTIYGQGFGETKGLVYFGDENGTRADFNFPQICANSIWSDRQVIVKVPAGLKNGKYKITMKVGTWPAVDTGLIQPAANQVFEASSSLSLKPSLCKINPVIGKVNSAIDLYGEYFGLSDNNSKARFQLNKDQKAPFDYWGQDNDPKITGITPDKISTKVPAQAITGPVRVVKGSPELAGNGLNFTVGVCQENAQCGLGSLCCPAGTPYASQCKVGTSEPDVCFPEIKACVYEWDFSTRGIPGIGDPCDKDTTTAKCDKDDTMCKAGLVCDDSNCTCKKPCNEITIVGAICKADDDKCAGTQTPVCNTKTCLCDPVGNKEGDRCYNGAVNGDCDPTKNQCGANLVCDIANCVCKQPCNNNLAGVCSPNNNKCLNPIMPVCDSATCLCGPAKSKPGDPCYNGAEPGNCDIYNNKCGPSLICNQTTCKCESIESCSGYGNQCSDSYFCPNSPGKCSARPVGSLVETGNCDFSCNSFSRFCLDGSCGYNTILNRCVYKGPPCALPKTVKDVNNNDVAATCVSGKWQISTNASCPSGWTNIGGNKCAQNNATCNLCANGLKCLAQNGSGICVIDQAVCPAGSTCSDDASHRNKCVKNNAGCECCCRKDTAVSNQDCCAPLKCEGACGAETNSANTKFGLCTGCTVKNSDGTINIEQSNKACNCSTSSGEYCDTSGAGGQGVCSDCVQLPTASCTTAGAGACCVDAMNRDGCRGGEGQRGIGPAGGQDYAYCSYYECKTAPAGDKSCSQENEKVAYSTNPVFSELSQCNNNCKSGEGGPCDGNPATPACDAKVEKCATGLICDPDNCRCKSNAPQFGLECSTLAATADQCRADVCPNFSCLDANGYGVGSPYNPADYAPNTKDKPCGLCCCDPNANPDQCKKISANLSCYANKGACTTTGANPKARGLCCGCSKDSDCGNGGSIGCGDDTCCQARPRVTNTIPADEAGNNGTGKVCRNDSVQATFNQPMQFNTFTGNVLVVGDYDSDQCPAGTEYLTTAYKPTIFARLKLWLAKIPLVNKFFTAEAKALTGNFCSVAGQISSLIKIDASGLRTTDLEFRPQQVLAANRKYYVIIEGDSDITDAVSNGVLSEAGIGLMETNAEVFNGVTFRGKIWSFTTRPEQAVNSGVCEIDHAEITPASYLFQTNKNDASDDTLGDKFNTVNDSDTVYRAVARAADGSELNPLVGVYNWSWIWSSGSPDILDFVQPSGGGTLPNNEKLLRAKVTATEGKSVITATAAVAGGKSYPATAEAYLMVCANPWPPYTTDEKGNSVWRSWQDKQGNCTPGIIGTDNCSDTNFELYYCRDAGGAGTADDLPAINNDTAKIRGQSLNLKCSDGSGSCAGKDIGVICDDNSGKCEVDILKELYFFREELPEVIANLATTTNNIIEQGGKVGLVWQPVSDAKKYTVYYGTSATNLAQSVSAIMPGTDASPFVISHLTNGVKYYFAVTATYNTGAESAYSNETSAIPADTIAPAVPRNLAGTATVSSVTLNWAANNDDTVSYKVYYGASKDSNGVIIYGATVSVNINKCSADACSMTIDNLNSNATYYFKVTALDLNSRESADSQEISFNLKPIADKAKCQADLKQILNAIIAKRLEKNTYLLKITNSYCSACSCADPKSTECASKMTETLKSLGFSGLLRNPWNDSYSIDENEYEFSSDPCRQDIIYSGNTSCGSVLVPFFTAECK